MEARMFLTMIITLRRRRAIPLDLFFAYWVNAHAAQIASRLPGIHDLWLHELSYESGLLWPRVGGIGFELPEQDRFEGIPEPAFASEEGVGQFLGAMAPLMDDEANIFEETIAYQSLGGNSKTYVDRTDDARGSAGLLRFMLFLQAREGVAGEAFREFMSETFAPHLASSDCVLKLRQHLFEPYTDDYGGMDARGLSHAKAPDKQYQAMCEISFANALELGKLTRSDTWRQLAAGLPQYASGCHAFGVGATHRLRRDGELTLDGLRTPMVADLIRRVGAVSQLEPAVTDLVLGRAREAVLG
jgi:hypothetical protein